MTSFPRWVARSASDRTDDWPYWFVADMTRGGLNRTAEAAQIGGYEWRPGAVFADRETAERIARAANRKDGESDA